MMEQVRLCAYGELAWLFLEPESYSRALEQGPLLLYGQISQVQWP